MLSYSLVLSDYSVSRFISRLQRLCSLSWRVIWLAVAWLFASQAIIGDYLYLKGWQQRDIVKVEMATHLFPYERLIALGTTYYILTVLKDEKTEQALTYINRGLDYDPNAADLLQAQMQYNYLLGKNDEAIRSYVRLSLIAPNSEIVKKIANLK